MKNPGLIIIDEEHDGSYKQQEGLRYHARDLALVRAPGKHPDRARLGHAVAGKPAQRLHRPLWPAAPERARRRRQAARFLRLDVKSRPLDSGISGPMQQAIGQTLAGPASIGVPQPPRLCTDPAVPRLRLDVRVPALRCAHDRAPALGELRCHHCGYVERMPRQCPQCNKVDLRPVAQAPNAPKSAWHSVPGLPGAAGRPRQHLAQDDDEQLFATIQKGQPCILVGTQMLPRATTFHGSPWCRSSMPTAAVLRRLPRQRAHGAVDRAGRRARGRAEEPGKVIIQTHLADHPLLVQLTEQGYFAFAEQALSERRAAGLPPAPGAAARRSAQAGAGRRVSR
jgi:primosomal protein N' (replication factor Y)